MTARQLLTAILALATTCTVSSAADPAVKMAEKFDDMNVYQVLVRVTISGQLTIPGGEGKTSRSVAMSGSSRLHYDERLLPSDDTAVKKVVRAYRTVEFSRNIGDQEQKAGVREAVRRMVVLRADGGKKAPYSPDGPLTFGEIDVVKNDLFSPSLVAGLLPPNAVQPGDKWKATTAAISDLTDLDVIESGTLAVEYVGRVLVEGRKHARLAISGTIQGINEDGPNRQKLEGIGYFDLEADRLSYLKLAGTHEMLGADGKITGRIEGSFVMERKASDKASTLSDATLKPLALKPDDDNTLLLYDNPEIGLKFLYPRRWRVQLVQGRQITLDEPKGGGVLFTITTPNETPTAAAFHTDVKAYMAKQKAKLTPVPEPKRVSSSPATDRFGFDAELDSGKSRLEYALVYTPAGGVTMAARLPEKVADELKPDIDRILKGLTVNKPAK
jgi:hypothetical protein